MPLEPVSNLTDAQALVQRLVSKYDAKYGYGTMSYTVYDSAWVSMVARPDDIHQVAVFPECTEYLLNTQMADGGWEGYNGVSDCLLNSLAALLALKKRRDISKNISDDSAAELTQRIGRATEFLRGKILQWDPESTLQVGFEIIAPALLRYLQAEGISFDFPQRSRLEQMEREKLRRFSPEVFKTDAGKGLTALHSLEAFIGRVDFDRVKHLKTFGSMMASPAATAAYLINSSTWDEEAEDYLRHILRQSADNGFAGGVPSAFPSTYFEYSWVLSTLLEHGFKPNDLGSEEVQKVASILQQGLHEGGGHIGFDDTAKTLHVLNLLGRKASASHLVDRYEAETHFRTYALERNPSLSVNCNVLIALLSSPDVNARKAIHKCAGFICKRWWEGSDSLEDKWNLSPQYSVMLICQSLAHLLDAWDQGYLPDLSNDFITVEIPVTLFQAAVRTLHHQGTDGSWWGSREQTAYAVLSLVHIASLPFVSPILGTVEEAIRKGRQFLDESSTNVYREYLWIEKITYYSPVITEAYILSALKCSKSSETHPNLAERINVPHDRIVKFSKFWSQLPMYREAPHWKLKCSLIEGYLFLPRLLHRRLDVFSRNGLDEDRYMEYIPFSWTGANIIGGYFFSANLIYDMMVISLLNYQVDEFMESTVGANIVSGVRSVIEGLFARSRDGTSTLTSKHTLPSPSTGYLRKSLASATYLGALQSTWNWIPRVANVIRLGVGLSNTRYTRRDPSPISLGTTNESSDFALLEEVRKKLVEFTSFVLDHPNLRYGDESYGKILLRQELRTFLLAHVQQIEDNNGRVQRRRLAVSDVARPNNTFYDWIHSTSAKHTSCCYSFAFILGHVTNAQQLHTVRETFVAEDLCSHLATLCRMYNDYGSLRRDRDEDNINSMDFREFGHTETSAGDVESLQKKDLWALIEYERICFEASRHTLSTMLHEDGKNRLVELVEFFSKVTDTYGEVYVARDIGIKT